MSNQLINKPPFGTPLNRSHPLAKKCFCSFTLNEYGGSSVFNPVLSDYGKANSNLSWYGDNIDLTGANYITIPDRPEYNPKAISIAMLVKPNLLTLSAILFKGSAYPGNTTYYIWFYDTGKIEFSFKAGGEVRQLSQELILTANNWYFVICQYDNFMGSQIFINNLLVKSYSATYGDLDKSGDSLYIGKFASYYSNTIYKYIYLFNGSLTYSERQSLYIDPYQMYRPSMPYWFWSETISVTGTLGGSLTRLSGDLDGTITITGTISGELDRLSGNLTGIFGKTDIVLTGSLDRLTGSFSGVCQVNAALAGALGRLTGDFSGTITVVGTLEGSLGRLTGSLRGRYGSGKMGMYIEIGVG